MAVDVFPIFAAALQGIESVSLKKALPGGLTYEDGFLLPFPQLLGIEEEVVTSSTPGGNQTADENSKVIAATLTLRWARLNLQQLAQIQGSLYSLTGSPGNRQHRLKRRSSDTAPFFKIEGRVDYVGSDFPGADYHLVAYRCKMVGTPNIQHETGENYASIEMQFKAFYRSDGEFYDLVLNETGVPLTATADNTAPTVVSTTPADNASGVVAGSNIVVGFSEPVILDVSNYTLLKVVSATDVQEVDFEASINEDRDAVTLAPATDPGSNFNLRIANVRDLAGNYQATPVNRQFATAA